MVKTSLERQIQEGNNAHIFNILDLLIPDKGHAEILKKKVWEYTDQLPKYGYINQQWMEMLYYSMLYKILNIYYASHSEDAINKAM